MMDLSTCNCCALTTWFNAFWMCGSKPINIVRMDTYANAPFNKDTSKMRCNAALADLALVPCKFRAQRFSFQFTEAKGGVGVHMFTYSLYTCLHIYLRTDVHYSYIYVLTCTHSFIYSCVHVCMYVCSYVYPVQHMFARTFKHRTPLCIYVHCPHVPVWYTLFLSQPLFQTQRGNMRYT